MENLLTPEEAAQHLRTTTGTLANWRARERGPKFLKLGRKVVYPRQELERYKTESMRPKVRK